MTTPGAGWCIRSETGLKSPKTGQRVVHVSWWYGPDHSWGRTWGSPERAKTWPTKKAAESAAASEYGLGWKFQPKRDTRMKAQVYSLAVAEWEAKQAAYQAKIAIEAST